METLSNISVSDRCLIAAFGASLAFHLTLISLAPLVTKPKPHLPATISVKLVEAAAERPNPGAITPPKPKLKTQSITAPKLLSKPDLPETQPLVATGTAKDETKDRAESARQPTTPPLVLGSSQDGRSVGGKTGESEGVKEGAGNLIGIGDGAVASGSGLGATGLGRGTQGNGSGGGVLGEKLSALARPLGGYQVKPRYPDSARTSGAQGTTLLKLQVLENGRVGEVFVEQSAGHRDLDNAAADAVKKWLFEPARMGKEAVAVWVILPVKFELQR